MRPSTKMFMLSIALWAIATISYVNVSFLFVPGDFASTMLPPVFISAGFAMAALGLIFRRAERALYERSTPDVAVRLTLLG